MKYFKKIMSLLLMLCLIAGMLPVYTETLAEEAGETIAYAYKQIGNTGAEITVSSEGELSASVMNEELATVAVQNRTIAVTVKDGAVGIACISVQCGEKKTLIEVPLGYTTFVFEDENLTVYEGSDAEYEIGATDLAGNAYTVTAAEQEDGGRTYTVAGEQKLVVEIKKKGGTYAFSGHSDDMSVAVKKEATKPAVLLLAGLSLTSSYTAPLTIKKDSTSTVTVTALAGSVNTLTDAKLNNADLYGSAEDGGDGTNAEYAESAVIKAKTAANLTLDGSGTLRLNCNTKNAIKIGEYGSLTVEDLKLEIISAGHGISADHQMQISSGTIVIEAEGDGIRSNPDAVNADAGCAGIIAIEHPEITIRAGSDGIQAAQKLSISGGEYAIKTGNGYNDASFNSETMSCKGLKASGSEESTEDTSNEIQITGGQFALNTADDAVHSDGYVTITGGVFNIRTGDDGIHADTTLILGEEQTDDALLSIDVQNSYEGLEAGTVYIYSGSYHVCSADDGINAAGGSDGQSNPGDHFNPGGGRPGGFPISGQSASNLYSLNIYGGNVYVNAEGDGLDSNGTLSLTGGNIIVWGAPARGDNEPIDCDGTLTIQGATVFAAGSGSMMTTPSSASQPYVRSTGTIAAGKTIRVNNNSSIVYETEAIKNINYVLYSSPEMTSAGGWSITATEGGNTPEPGSSEEPDGTPEPGTPEEPPALQDFYYGDVNADGVVNAEDALLILQHAAQLTKITDSMSLIQADANRSGGIDAADALYALQVAAGIREKEKVNMGL